LAVEWWRRPDRNGWLWALAAVGPLAVGLSLPSLFVLGGGGLSLAWPVWRTGRWRARAALGVFGLGVLVTFVGLTPFYKPSPQDAIRRADDLPPLRTRRGRVARDDSVTGTPQGHPARGRGGPGGGRPLATRARHGTAVQDGHRRAGPGVRAVVLDRALARRRA